MRTRNQTIIGLISLAVLLVLVGRAVGPLATGASESFRSFLPQLASDEPRSAAPSPTATLPPGGTPTSAPTLPPGATPTPTTTATPTAQPTVAPTPTPPPPSGNAFSIAFLDVGQGDAILITINGERMLIDGGRSSTLALSRLQALGVTDLDAVLMTHPDADHIGGLAAVLDAYPVERIYLNGGTADTQVYGTFITAVNAEGAQIITPTRGATIPLGGLSLPVLHPVVTSTEQSNDNSLVLRLTCGSVSVLLTGDAEFPAESSMLSAGLIGDVDVLKVAHHGANSASSLAFLQAANPEVAVISAGRTNAYGHPTAEVLGRLASVGANLVYTDTTEADDTVVMTSDCASYDFSAPITPPPSPTSTPTPTPVPTGTPSATVTPVDGVTITSITSPIKRALQATLTASTYASASCSITYVTPSGTTSSAAGLVAKIADASGYVSWTWTIGGSTSAGTGTVTVTCNGQSASTPIEITL